jgi:hypothetical protein
MKDHATIGEGLHFFARNTEVMTIGDASGNARVGIGTTAPANTLHVNGQTRLGSWTKIMHTGDSTQAGYIGSGSDLAFGDANDLCLRGTDSIKFTTNDGQSDAMTIDVNGKVGIGTTSPIAPIHTSTGAVANSTNKIVAFFGGGSSGNQYGTVILRLSRFHTENSVSTTMNTTGLDIEANSGGSGPHRWGSYDDVNFINLAHGGSSGPYANMNFVTGTGSSTKAIAMTIGGGTQGGKVGIGTTSPTQKLHIAGNMRLTGALYDKDNSLGSAGQILTTNGSATYWSAAGSGTISGSGTDNYIPKFNGTSAVENSAIYEHPTADVVTFDNAIISKGNWSGLSGSFGVLDYVTNDNTLRLTSQGANSTTRGNFKIELRESDEGGVLNPFYIKNDGNVGIGTSSPVAQLHVGNGNQSPSSTMGDPGVFIESSGTSNAYTALQVKTGGGLGLAVTNAAKVGIGTASPGTLLHMAGGSAIRAKIVGTTDVSITAESTGANSYSFFQLTNDARAWSIMNDGANSDIFKIRDSTAGADRFTINSSGNVGIGTTAPAQILHVAGGNLSTIRNNMFGITSNSPGTGGETNVYHNAYYDTVNSREEYLVADEACGIKFINGRIDFRTAAAGSADGAITWINAMSILADGKVGIGTTAPTYKLQVGGGSIYLSQGTAGTGLFINDSEASAGSYSITTENISSTEGYLKFGAPSNETHHFVFDGGNVGIGTTSPAGKLEVYGGDLYLRGGDINLRDGTGVSGSCTLEYNSATGTMRFDRPLYVTSSSDNYFAGDVGIGTTAPVVELEVHDAADHSAMRISTGGTNKNTDLRFSPTGTGKAYIAYSTSAGSDIDFYSYKTGVGSVMTLDADGSVGIGTTAPAQILHVAGGNLSTIRNNMFGITSNTPVASGQTNLYHNAYYDTTDSRDEYLLADEACKIQFINGKINFRTAAAGAINGAITWIDAMSILADGSVGIGTAAPNYKLQVVGTFRASDTGYFAKTSGTGLSVDHGTSFGTIAGDIHKFTGKVGIGTTAPGVNLDILDAGNDSSIRLLLATGNTTGTLGNIVFGNTNIDNTLAKIQCSQDGATDSARLTFHTEVTGGALTERMRITSGGKVGIGTTAPDTLLHVYDASATPVVRIQGNTGGSSEAQLHLEGYKAAATAGAVGSIIFENHNASEKLGKISVIKNSTSVHDVGDMAFYTHATGGTGDPVERMRILSDGNVGIGTTAPDQKLSVSGNIQARSGGWFIARSADNAGYSYLKNPSTSGSEIAFHTSGEKMRLLSNGKVGIGTAAPEKLLHLYSSSDTTLRITAGTSNDALLNFGPTDDTDKAYVNYNTAVNKMYISALNTRGADITIDGGTGNVGIGTTAPLAKLHISQEAGQQGPASGVFHGTTGLIVSGVDGIMGLGSRDDNTAVSHVLSFPRYKNSDGTLISKFGIVVTADTGSQNSNLLSEFGINYGTGTYDYTNARLFTIKRDGKVGIGLTPSSQILETKGNISFYNTSGANPNTLKSQGSNDASISGHFHTTYGCWVRNESATRAAGMDGTTSGAQLMLYSNSVERVRIDNNGNVGIGTNAPDTNLEIYQSDSNSSYVHFTNSTTGGGADNGTLVGIDAAENFRIHNYEATDNIFVTNGIERMRILSDGNVGIGTTAPTALLHVKYAAAGYNKFEYGANQYTGFQFIENGTTKAYLDYGAYQATDGFTFYAGGGGSADVAMKIKEGGKVIIGGGATEPDHILHVVGTGQVARMGNNRWMGTNTVTIGTTYVTGVTVNLGDSTGGYLKVTIAGDWSSHSAIGYMAEFFIQKGSTTRWSQPGSVIREVTNQHDSSYITAQILDPTLNSGNADFKIQFKTDAGTATNATIIYEYIGIANSVT